ncbi:MAG: xylulokinase, partial [Coriobacteriaceae bacterium]|nr:xylulokinase [Coriobacteriaceae bacterium]
MAYFIGVDVGTSSIKATLADEWGSVVISAVRSYSCSHPHSGWSEQDPQDWCDAAIFAVRELVSLPEVDPSAVKGLSFGGQMHGLVVLDATDEIIRPAILWNDGRSTKECAYLNEVIGREKITQWCGNIAFPGFTAPKLLWMREHEPEFFSRIAKVMLPKDYLAYRFTGAFCTDVSDASGTLLFDVRHRIWSRPMIELVGLQDGQLPDVCESWEVIGTLLPEVAKRMGLSPSVCVAAGAGDNAAAAVGMGCVSEGQCNVSLGTSGTVFLPTQAMRLDAKNALHSFADATGAYHLMGCILSAASANDWWVKGILGSDVGRELSRIEVDLLGRNRVLFLP